MNDSTQAAIARKAAIRLAPEHPQLAQLTELVLAEDQPSRDQYDAGTAIALASLLVSAASSAWTIYRDLKEAGEKTPSKDAVSRRVRVKMEETHHTSAGEHSHLLDVVVEETIRIGSED